MAEPPPRGLRAARRSGLTSPDPVRAPTAATATRTPDPEPGTLGKPQSRPAAGRPRPDSPRKTPRAGIGAGNGLPESVGGSRLSARLEAQAAAHFAAPTVCALNDPEPVTDPRSALAAVLALPIAPSGWKADLPVAMGLTTAALDEVVEATIRLVSGTLRLARERNPLVDRQPEIGRYLIDGTLERLLK